MKQKKNGDAFQGFFVDFELCSGRSETLRQAIKNAFRGGNRIIPRSVEIGFGEENKAFIDYHRSAGGAIHSGIQFDDQSGRLHLNINGKLTSSHHDSGTGIQHEIGFVYDNVQDNSSIVGSIHVKHTSPPSAAKRGAPKKTERDIALQLYSAYLVQTKGWKHHQADAEISKIFDVLIRQVIRVRNNMETGFIFYSTGEAKDGKLFICGHNDIIDYSVTKSDVVFVSNIYFLRYGERTAHRLENVKFSVTFDPQVIPKILQILRNACQK
jgi:hypothetical protein